jgi:hypothetical protein
MLYLSSQTRYRTLCRILLDFFDFQFIFSIYQVFFSDQKLDLASDPPTLSILSMARDPLLPEIDENQEHINAPVRDLDRPTIAQMFQDVTSNDIADARREEATQALRSCLRFSVLPCIHMISEFSNIPIDTLIRSGLQQRLLRIVSNNARIRFHPPWSPNRIYHETILDWVQVCVASDD